MKNHYKFWIVLSLILVFLAGLGGGILIKKHAFPDVPREKPKRRSTVHFPSMDMMARELDLSNGQQEKIKNIFKQNEEKFKALRTEMHDQLTSIRSQLKKDILDVLSPGQRQKFEALIEKYVSQRRKEYGERGEKSENYEEKKGK